MSREGGSDAGIELMESEDKLEIVHAKKTMRMNRAPEVKILLGFLGSFGCKLSDFVI